MMLALDAPSVSSHPVLDGVVLDGASWDLYELLLRDVGDRNIRVTFDRGRLLIMSPRPDHESWKQMVGRLIDTLSLEWDIPIRSFGSTTWRSRNVERGLEADKCYYVQNEPQIRGRLDIDLSRDPPPDLAIEIEVTHSPIDRPPIYAAMKIPELWRFNGKRFACLLLQSDGSYQSAERSAAFPMLKVADLEPFMSQISQRGENEIIRSFQAWAQEENRGGANTSRNTI